MDFNPSALHGAITTANNPDYHSDCPKKKKRGPIHFFRVALFMLKQTKSKKKKVADVNSNSLLKCFVGSMRPFHAQNHHTPPMLTEAPMTGFPGSPEHMDVFTPPMSPAPASVSSWGNMSQYASAVNLQELDHDHDHEIVIDQHHDDDCGLDGDKDGDDMIDAKAEEFIAQFYQQIKVQNQVYNDRRNKRVN